MKMLKVKVKVKPVFTAILKSQGRKRSSQSTTQSIIIIIIEK